MVKIRLTRIGKRNDPSYRVIAIDESDRREGRALEILGYWHPQKNTKELNTKALDAWVAKGAQVSPAVKKLLA